MTAYTITNITDETHDTKTFRFSGRTHFIAGQYCLIKKDGEQRPFTYSCAPGHDYFELTIKRMGGFTTALHACRPGDQLDIEGPCGEAYNYTGEEDIVFLAGGSGITPFMSIIRQVNEKKLSTSMMLFYANRTQQDIIFRAQLEGLPVPCVHVLSDDKNFAGEQGYIRKELIEKYVNITAEHTWYICGPPGFTKAMQAIVEQYKQPIKVESWMLPGKT